MRTRVSFPLSAVSVSFGRTSPFRTLFHWALVSSLSRKNNSSWCAILDARKVERRKTISMIVKSLTHFVRSRWRIQSHPTVGNRMKEEAPAAHKVTWWNPWKYIWEWNSLFSLPMVHITAMKWAARQMRLSDRKMSLERVTRLRRRRARIKGFSQQILFRAFHLLLYSLEPTQETLLEFDFDPKKGT